jgi:hypothetical protein
MPLTFFSFDPIPTKAKKPGPLLLVYFMGELNQREGGRGNRLQGWVENTNMTECTQEIGYLQSINSDKHPFTRQFFL